MIRALGIRTYLSNGKKATRKVYFKDNFFFDSIKDVFDSDSISKVVGLIPPKEAYNLFFHPYQTHERRIGEKQELKLLEVIYFDFVVVPDEYIQATLDSLSKALDIKTEDMTVVHSGRGMQVYLFLKTPTDDSLIFDKTKDGYELLVDKINMAMVNDLVPCLIDQSSWVSGHVTRLPDTINRTEESETQSRIIQRGSFNPVFDLFSLVNVNKKEAIKLSKASGGDYLYSFPTADIKGMCDGCEFLKSCEFNASNTTETQWRFAANIISKTREGQETFHRLRSEAPNYTSYKTDVIYKEGSQEKGALTCGAINSVFDCSTCDNYGLVKSPVLLKSKGFVPSKDAGFREVKISKLGLPVTGPVVYLDLIKHFTNQFLYKTVLDRNGVYIYNGKFWEQMHERKINEWATIHVNPAPSSSEMREFYQRLTAYNVIKFEQLRPSMSVIGFENGVLNAVTGDFFEHNPDFMLTSIVPYNYDSKAECPTFDRFIHEISSGDKAVEKILLEFGGYAISGDEYWLHKALMLYGDGSNGKSVFIEVLGKVCGEGNYSSIALKNLKNSTARYGLLNKKFNVSEETSEDSFTDSELFKTLASGGEIQVKKLYENEIDIKNTAKILILFNGVPVINDMSYGFKRRVVLVHLSKVFKHGDAGFDPYIKTKLFAESAGIANKLINAYKDLKERGDFEYSKDIENGIDRILNENNPVYLFKDEKLEIEPFHDERTVDVYTYYRMFCESRGYRIKNNIAFGREMARLGFKNKVKKIDEKIIRVYEGVRYIKENI